MKKEHKYVTKILVLRKSGENVLFGCIKPTKQCSTF